MKNSNTPKIKPSSQQAFTLTELLATVAIAGILSLFAAPTFSDLQAKERRVVAINKIIGAIRFTRSKAQQFHKVITFCPTANGNNCSRNWNLPFIIFIDLNNDRIKQADEPLLKKLAAINPQDKLKWKAFRNSNSLQFLPSGITNHQNGTFLYCPKINRDDLAKGIIMTKMGRTRLSKDTNGDGIQEGAGGRILSCG